MSYNKMRRDSSEAVDTGHALRAVKLGGGSIGQVTANPGPVSSRPSPAAYRDVPLRNTLERRLVW